MILAFDERAWKRIIPNSITSLRIAGAVLLGFTAPFSATFFILYIFCGASDILDGYAARKLNAATKGGQVLDSIADGLFIGVLLIRLLPFIKPPLWVMLWASGVALVRIASLCVGFIRYRAFAWLHTWANKLTGGLLFAFPLLYAIFGISITAGLLCGAASLSALEELIINLRADKLDRERRSWFAR